MRSARALVHLVLLGMLFLPGLATAQDASPTPAATPVVTEETIWPRFEQGIVYGENDPAKQVMDVYTLEPR